MSNITINDINDDHYSFEILFHFKPNDYFNHEAIIKKYYYDNNRRAFTHAEGYDIQWSNNDINPTLRRMSLQKRNGKERIVYENQDSFFNIFKPSSNGHSLILEDEAYFFKNDLFIHQLEYYLNIANKPMAKLKQREEQEIMNYNNEVTAIKSIHEKKIKKKKRNKKDECKNQ